MLTMDCISPTVLERPSLFVVRDNNFVARHNDSAACSANHVSRGTSAPSGVARARARARISAGARRRHWTFPLALSRADRAREARNDHAVGAAHPAATRQIDDEPGSYRARRAGLGAREAKRN